MVEIVTQTTWDSQIVVYSKKEDLATHSLASIISSAANIDASLHSSSSSLLLADGAHGSRLVLAPTGKMDRDFDDVRNIAKAVKSGVLRAIAAGSKRPLVQFIIADILSSYAHATEVGLLAALQELAEPLESVEWKATRNGAGMSEIPIQLGFEVFSVDGSKIVEIDKEAIIKRVSVMEKGRKVARDIMECDPERMAPLKAADYLKQAFANLPNIEVSVETRREIIDKEYPLLSAVARASYQVPRHAPAVVKIEYKSPDQQSVKDNIFLVGKGVTYDTGGADVKTNGAMRGMSRDKGGAAGVAGFLMSIAQYQPKNLNASALLGFVRNSVGADSYVSDEIIVSRAGVRVLVGNTDAEGRMVMADLLAEQTEKARILSNSQLFTVATLTGHVIRAYGPYPACLDNGPARLKKMSLKVAETGAEWGEPWEISTLRREDYEIVKAKSTREDVIQCNTAPSTMTSRGHQFPAAFMMIASGLSKHGLDCKNGEKLAYTHMDIAGGAEEEGAASGSLPKATACPVVTLSALYLFNANTKNEKKK